MTIGLVHEYSKEERKNINKRKKSSKFQNLIDKRRKVDNEIKTKLILSTAFGALTVFVLGVNLPSIIVLGALLALTVNNYMKDREERDELDLKLKQFKA